MTECCFQSSNSTTNVINKNNINNNNKNNNNNNNNNKFSDFATICSFILSHPLYLSYLIFFSPYLLKLLSFLSPLFITTFLLVFSLLTTLIPLHTIINSKEGFFVTVYNTLLENLRPKFDDDGENSQPIEEFEVYKIVFDTPVITEVMEQNPDENERFEEIPVENERFEENPIEVLEENVPQNESEKTGEQCESVNMESKTGEITKPNKVMEEVKKFESFLAKTGSEVNKIVPINEGLKPKIGSLRVDLPNNEGLKKKFGSLRVDDEKKLSEAFSQTVGSPPYLGSFGSMRKEKEWRRTLACKLFEERHNWSNNGVNSNGGEEGMDSLWETYETEPNRGKKIKEESKKGKRREKIEDLMVVNDDEDENDDYFGGDEDDNGKFCCLQALKLSAGKMNLNMGRPNLVKIGKAFKGMGWLQSHVRRQGKKGYK